MNLRCTTATRWLAAIALLALIGLLARGLDWPAVGRALSAAAPGMLVTAALLNVVSLVAKGFAWWLFLRAYGVRALSQVMRATFAGAALNNLLPWNAGDIARAVFVSRAAGVGSAGVLAALALERLAQLFAGLTLLALAAWFLPFPPRIVHASVVALVVIVIGFLLAWRHRDDLIPRMTAPEFRAALAADTLAWILQLATYHLVARALGLPVTLGASCVLLAAVNLAFIVRLTPGGIGVFQIGYAAAALALDVPREPAVATALLLQAIQIIPVTLLGIYFTPGFVWFRAESAA